MVSQDRICNTCVIAARVAAAGGPEAAAANPAATLPFMGHATPAALRAQQIVREQAAARARVEISALDAALAALGPPSDANAGARRPLAERRNAWVRAREECLGGEGPADPGWDEWDAEYPLFVRELFSKDSEMDVEKAVVEAVLNDGTERGKAKRKEAEETAKAAAGNLLELLRREGVVPRGAKGPLRRKRTLGLFQLIDGIPVLTAVVISSEARRRAPGGGGGAGPSAPKQLEPEKFMCAASLWFTLETFLTSLCALLSAAWAALSRCGHPCVIRL